MNRITKAALIEDLNAIDTSDPEKAHVQADALLLAALGPEVREAYERVITRSKWWVCG